MILIRGRLVYKIRITNALFAKFKSLEESGNANAQLKLGVMYKIGLVANQDYFEAVKWFRLAAERGNARAQFNLGLMHYNGQGVRQDKSEAKRWFGLACDNQDQGACDNYKILNEQGY